MGINFWECINKSKKTLFHEMKTKCHVNEFREKGNSIEKLTNYEQLRSELQKSNRGPYKSGSRQSLHPTSRNEFFW